MDGKKPIDPIAVTEWRATPSPARCMADDNLHKQLRLAEVLRIEGLPPGLTDNHQKKLKRLVARTAVGMLAWSLRR